MALTAKQKKQKTERSYRRRHAEELEQGSAVDTKTGDRFEIAILPRVHKDTNLRAPIISENLKLLKTPEPEKVKKKNIERRVRYAAMKTHMETVAHVIAAGGSAKQAAEKAGVSRRQVRKYMESGDFRDRIAELQEILGGKIRGRVMKEIERRTSPEVIQKMELLDVLRVGDRFGLGRGAGSVIVNDNREVHNYEATFNQLFHGGSEDPEQLPDGEEEGADFQEFEPSSVALSGGDT